MISNFNEFLNEAKPSKPILQDYEKDLEDFTSQIPSKPIALKFAMMMSEEINKHLQVIYSRITQSGLEKPHFSITVLGTFFKGETLEAATPTVAANYIKAYMGLKDLDKKDGKDLIWQIRRTINDYPDMSWNKYKQVIMDIAQEEKIEISPDALKKLGINKTDLANRDFGL